jgi:hypothetical protein
MVTHIYNPSYLRSVYVCNPTSEAGTGVIALSRPSGQTYEPLSEE